LIKISKVLNTLGPYILQKIAEIH